jgi:hypothetical protein
VKTVISRKLPGGRRCSITGMPWLPSSLDDTLPRLPWN